MYNQLEPLLQEQAKQIEDLSAPKTVKVNEPQSKTVQFEPSMKINYKFDEVISEANAEMNYENFDFKLFKGLDEEIRQAEKPSHQIKNLEGKYTKQHIQSVRDETFVDVVGIKLKYLDKALAELQRIKNPTVKMPAMASSTIQENLLKRLNNNIVCAELMRTLSIEELDDLFELNKGQAEIRMMIKARAFHLFRVVKESQVRQQALRLKSKIQAYENELMNPEHQNNLAKIENTIRFLFNDNKSNYPVNLHEMDGDFKGLKYRNYFS